MDKRASLPVQERILQLLQRLGIEQAHFMGYAPEDWQGLAANHPEVLASLTLFCVPPHRLDPSGLGALASRLLVFTDERNWSSAATDRALRSLQGMTLVPLPGYSAFLWSDLISDRTQEMSAVLLEFLGRIDKSLHLPAVNIPERKGELDGILYL